MDAKLEEIVNACCTESERHYVREIATTALRLGRLRQADRSQDRELGIEGDAERLSYFYPIPSGEKSDGLRFGANARRTARPRPGYREFGKRMAEAGWMVVTGAGSGIMGAAHEGAGRNLSFGVNIKLPFEQHANETIRGDKKLMSFRYFFTRKLFLLKESHAVTLFPGGFGTLDECFEVLTLLQTGKQTPLPVVMVESPETGYFQDLARFIEERVLGNGLISPQDQALYRIVKNPAEACAEVLRFYRIYHSSRYVGSKLMIRLARVLTSEEIESLNDRFSDIFRTGRIDKTQPLPEELGTDLHGLARIDVDFNRHDFGRLRSMIDAINDFE